MKTLCLIMTLLTISYTAQASLTVSNAPLLSNGVYEVSGQHSQYGPYSGTLELRDGLFLRTITYQKFFYRGLQVQEIWSGAILDQGLAVSLMPAEFIAGIPGLKRSPLAPSPALNLKGKWNPELATFEYSSPAIANGSILYRDTYLNKVDLARPDFSWKNLRSKTQIQELPQPFVIDLAFKLAIEKVVKWFQAQPELAQYPRGANFTNGNHFAVYDPTDFVFYQSHPELLRVNNKVVDEISLLESYLRHSAYAYSDEQKMQSFTTSTEYYNLSSFGLAVHSQVDDQGNILSQEPDGDGALWSGMYAGALAMKYQTAPDEKTLLLFKRTLHGMFTLMDVTGDAKNFARNIRLRQGQEPSKGNWHIGSPPYEHLMWLSEGNNDMFKGILQTFAWAYHILPSQDPIRSELNTHAMRLMNLNVASRTGNKAFALGLATLATHRADLREDYIQEYKKISRAEDFLGIDGGLYTKGISDWSGINLNMVSSITTILIADAIQKQFPTGELSRWDKLRGVKTEAYVLRQERESLLKQWAQYATAKREFVTLTAYAFAYRFGVTDFENKDKMDFDGLWKYSMRQLPWLLREMPLERSHFDMTIDHRLRADFSISSMPRLPWKSVKERQPIAYHIQGSEIYPWFELHGNCSNFVWKDAAFEFRGVCNKNTRVASIDYLFSYWMKKWAGL